MYGKITHWTEHMRAEPKTSFCRDQQIIIRNLNNINEGETEYELVGRIEALVDFLIDFEGDSAESAMEKIDTLEVKPATTELTQADLDKLASMLKTAADEGKLSTFLQVAMFAKSFAETVIRRNIPASVMAGIAAANDVCDAVTIYLQCEPHEKTGALQLVEQAHSTWLGISSAAIEELERG